MRHAPTCRPEPIWLFRRLAPPRMCVAVRVAACIAVRVAVCVAVRVAVCCSVLRCVVSRCH